MQIIMLQTLPLITDQDLIKLINEKGKIIENKFKYIKIVEDEETTR